jgi:hypothetical protein
VVETRVAKSSRPAWLIAALAVVAGVVLGAVAVILFWPDDSDAEAVSLVRADDAGSDPFGESVQTGAPVIAQPAADAAHAVHSDLPLDDATAVRVATGTEAGLYGGSGDAQVCDPAKLVTYLDAHTDKAQAFSGVLGITPAEIGDYVASLTPVVLLSDTLVTNHGFRDGHATDITSVLQAGTAVMVDPQGVPRVKCNCGNPLTPPEVVPSSEWDVQGDPWDGFDAAAVTGVVGGNPVDELAVCDLTTGETYTVPVGSSATSPPITEQPAPSSTITTPAPSVSELRGVNWRNRTYALGDCPPGDVTLRDGSFEDPAEGFGVRLVGVLYGDFTGDGNDEAVVKFECYPIGGNAYPATANVVFTSDATGPVQLGAPFAGRDATIVGDTVQTTELVWGPSDPRCCPSTTVTHTWQYTGGAWVSS